MADFKFYLNRQGPKGEPGAKGEKGDNGNTPTFSDGINTPTVYTMQIDMGDGNVFETQNLKYPMRDDGGNYLRYDRTNSTVTLSAPNIADLQRTSGEVTLASVSDVENEDTQDTDAVSMELRNADQLALNNEINRIDGDIDTVDDKVDREIQNRQDADTQLTNKINTDVGNEATARSNADIALSGRIDGLDTSKANKSEVYTKSQTDSLLNSKSNVGHTHNYNDLTNKPVIGNGTITITQGGVTKGTFTTNQSGNSTVELDAGGGGGATYTEGPGITINQNNEISANVDNNTIVIDGNLLKANIPDVSNFVSNTQLASTLESYPTNNALSNAITYQTVSVPTPATYTFNRIMNLNIWEYSTNPGVETGGGWTKISTSTYTRNSQLVIPSDSSYNNGLWVTLLNLQDTECVKCNSGYTFSFECNPQITISYYSPEDGDTLITQQITINTPTNEVFNISSSSYGYTSLNIGVLKNIYIKSFMVQYSYDGNGHTPSVLLAPIYNSNGEMEVYIRSEGIPVTTTKAVVADTAVDGSTISVDSNGQLTYIGPTGDVLPSQSGNSGKFLTTDGSTTSWATVSQPDMNQYYTKTQTDSLLDGKISNDIVQSPLEYLPDTTNSITYQNINENTLLGTTTSTRIDSYKRLVDDNLPTLGYPNNYINNNSINDTTLVWAEANLPNGLNVITPRYPELSNTPVNNATQYVYCYGYYNNGTFDLVAIQGVGVDTTDIGMAAIRYFPSTGNSIVLTYSNSNDSQSASMIHLESNSITFGSFNWDNLGVATNLRYGTYSAGGTLSSDDLNRLNLIDTVRVFYCKYDNYGSSTIDISKIKVVNPVQSVISPTAQDYYSILTSGTNIFDAHPESLSLKYDSNTLGVNASNELTVPTATTSNLGLVKPDGTTITINNGVISAASSAPSNMVTTDTTQNVTGVKSFTHDGSAALIAQAEYGITVSTNMSAYNSGYGVNLNKYGVDIRGQNNLGQITISSNSTLGQTAYLFTIKQASNKTKFIHDDYLSDKKIYRDNNATNFLLEKDMLDGTTIQYNGTSGKVEVIGGGSSYTLPTASTSTLGGVKIDGTTITIDSNGVISAAGGSTPSNMVTTDTSQDISGTKTFRVTTSNYTPTLRIAGYSSTGNNDFIVLNSNDYTNPAGACIGYAFSQPVVKVFGGTSGAYSSFYCHGGIYRNGSDTFTFWKDYAKNSKIILKNYQDIIMDSSMLDGTYLKWDSTNNKITIDIQAIKDAIDALSNSSGSASQGPDLNPGGWL